MSRYFQWMIAQQFKQYFNWRSKSHFGGHCIFVFFDESFTLKRWRFEQKSIRNQRAVCTWRQSRVWIKTVFIQIMSRSIAFAYSFWMDFDWQSKLRLNFIIILKIDLYPSGIYLCYFVLYLVSNHVNWMEWAGAWNLFL